MPGENYTDRDERIKSYPFITYTRVPQDVRRNLYYGYLESLELRGELEDIVKGSRGAMTREGYYDKHDVVEVVDKIIAVLKRGGGA